MSHQRLKIQCALIATLIFITGASPPLAVAATEAGKTSAQLAAVVKRLNALDQWLSDAGERRRLWLIELQRKDRQVAEINRQTDTLRTVLKRIGVELSALNARQDKLNRLSKKQAQLINEHIGAAYRLTGQDFFKQLLNQESPDTFTRMIRYHRHFSDARFELIEDYEQTLDEIKRNNSQLSEQKTQQIKQQDTLVEEQRLLDNERENRSALIAKLDLETADKTIEYEQLKQDQTRLARLLAELQQQIGDLDGSGFIAAKGTLPMPVEGKIIHAYGAQRAEGRLRWHGIDIRAKEGTPVRAVYQGRVIFADWLRGFGLLTILDHGSGYMTLYGHADILNKNVGDWVESGEQLAGAGNSGGAQTSGIYFEVRHKGQTADPISWVAR